MLRFLVVSIALSFTYSTLSFASKLDRARWQRRIGRSFGGSRQSSGDEKSYEFTTVWYSRPLDHFNFHEQQEFQQKVLISDTHWNGGDAPIFFYT